MRWAFVGAVLVACGGSSSGEAGDAGVGGGGGGSGAAGGTGAAGASSGCVPNQQVSCACAEGKVGYQACLASGSGFGPCVCPGAAGGGAGGMGGSGGGAGCPSAMKHCAGLCVTPDASNGCSLTTCTACSPPANSGAVCNGSECDFVCDAGYAKSGLGCSASGGGGSGGSGGSGGGFCNPTLCPAPAPPAVKCCTAPWGPCGIDKGEGNGCQLAAGGAGGAGGTGGWTCPPTKPANGAACQGPASCQYGVSLCLCQGMWLCS